MPYKPLEKRIMEKVLFQPNGCWTWTGAFFKKKYGNYGQLRMGGKDGKAKKAHRISYTFFVGEIPEGKEIDHLCHNTMCVNPKHLEAVTHAQNMQRRKDSGLEKCKHGHLYSKETTYINPRKRRECKICIKNNMARFLLKKHST